MSNKKFIYKQQEPIHMDYSTWIINNTLDLYDLGLTYLSPLPQNLHILRCDQNQLTKLPELPANLTSLNCNLNRLKYLPTLPSTLKTLECSDNHIIKLPVFPPAIEAVFCGNNKLTSLPSLPNTINFLFCEDNPYLYVSDKMQRRFPYLEETPNYPFLMNNLKKICHSQKRRYNLQFCSDLQDQIDEFRYRPNNAGYDELTRLNKNRFADL